VTPAFRFCVLRESFRGDAIWRRALPQKKMVAKDLSDCGLTPHHGGTENFISSPRPTVRSSSPARKRTMRICIDRIE